MASDDPRLILICRKLRRGIDLTPDEQQYWKQYCSEHPFDVEALLGGLLAEEEESSDEMVPFDTFCKEYNIPLTTPYPHEKPAIPALRSVSRSFPWWWVAASLLLLFVPLFVLLIRQKAPHVVIVGNIDNPVTGRYKATLYIPGREAVLLNDSIGLYKEQQEAAIEEDINFEKFHSESAVHRIVTQLKPLNRRFDSYKWVDPSNSEKLLPIHMIQTHLGSTYKILLADSTLVHLNAGSSLEYPASFGGGERVVKLLHGEAYFEVKHKDNNQPFYVLTSSGSIEVLGTKFNVNAYVSDRMQTTIIEGSVGISNGKRKMVLMPGDQAAVDRNAIAVSKVTEGDATDWVEGKFTFRNARLDRIIQELARWYPLTHVDYMDSVKNERFTFIRVDRGVELADLLEDISVAGPVRFTWKDSTLLVFRK